MSINEAFWRSKTTNADLEASTAISGITAETNSITYQANIEEAIGTTAIGLPRS